MTKIKTKVFNFHMPAPLRARLLAERDRAGVSEAELIRRALDQYLERRERRRGPARRPATNGKQEE